MQVTQCLKGLSLCRSETVVKATCDILFTHLGQKRDDFKSIQPLPNTRKIAKRSEKLLSLDHETGIYFCTGTCN